MPDTRKDIRLEDLSPSAQAAVTSKAVAGRKRTKEWKRLIDELADFDAVSDRLQARARNFLILGIVLAALGVVGGIFVAAGSSSGGVPQALLVLPLAALAAGAALAICHGARWSRFRKLDLANDFRLCIPPLLDVLADDLEPRAKVRLQLDMAGIGKEKLVRKHNIPPGRFRKVIESVYHDPWCHLAAQLADGSQLVLDIENHLIEHDRRWTTRSRSGKTKFKRKSKWKKLVVVSAAVVPNAERLAWDEGEVGARSTDEKLKLAEKKGAKVCRLVRKFKFSAVNQQPDGVASSDDIVGMFMELFKMLDPAGARS